MKIDEYKKWCMENIAENEKGWQRFAWLYDHAEEILGRNGATDMSKLTDDEIKEFWRLIEKISEV